MRQVGVSEVSACKVSDELADCFEASLVALRCSSKFPLSYRKAAFRQACREMARHVWIVARFAR